MNDEINNQSHNNTQPVQSPDNSQVANDSHAAVPSGRKIIQPSEAFRQEIQAQQETQPQSAEPATSVPQTSRTDTASNPVDGYPGPTMPGQMQAGMSGSQLEPRKYKSTLSGFNPKRLIIKSLVALALLGGIFTALVMTNIVALSEFKNVKYTNSEGTSFNLNFYSKHGSKQLDSGNKQLISKVSKSGKFPIILSISTTDGASGYNRAKNCAGITKAFDVQNNNLNQKISVCDFGKNGGLPANSLYIAAFTHNDKSHIITIGQDYGDVNLSSQSGAQESLTKFGMEPYEADIERIIASIKAE